MDQNYYKSLTMGSATSTNQFSKNTTSLQIMQEFGKYAKDRYVIVTGGNSGLGFESSRALAEYGAHVIIACRNPKLGQEAVHQIQEKHPLADVSTLELDLSSFASIEEFVTQYKATGKPLHILLNNAGIMGGPKSFTKDGHESQFGVNHLGHFYLTRKLMEVLQNSSTIDQPSRIVNLSSIGHYLIGPKEGIRFNDLKGEKYYDSSERYASSKLANILFTKELHERYYNTVDNQKKIISVAVHPGFILDTNLSRYSSNAETASFLWQSLLNGTIGQVVLGYFKTIEEGAATQLLACLDPQIVSGEYYADCHIEHQAISVQAKDRRLATDLWNASSDLTNIPK